MTARAKRKKNTAYSTHEYQVTKVTPTGEQVELISVIGSRDAFHKQIDLEAEGFQSHRLQLHHFHRRVPQQRSHRHRTLKGSLTWE